MKTFNSTRSLSLAIFVGWATISNAQERIQPSNPVVDGIWGFRAPSQYIILPRPPTHFNKGEPNIVTPKKDTIQSRQTQPYAYGWFGTKSSPHWSRQFGHQNTYTQWTLK